MSDSKINNLTINYVHFDNGKSDNAIAEKLYMTNIKQKSSGEFDLSGSNFSLEN